MDTNFFTISLHFQTPLPYIDKYKTSSLLSYTISLILKSGKPSVPRLNHLTDVFTSLKFILSVDVA